MDAMSTHVIFWRRLDVEGHDCCRLSPVDDGWSIEGVATFLHESQPTCLRYRVSCDKGWRTRNATVSGWLGDMPIELEIGRSANGAWQINGVDQDAPAELVDLDLGFTPATNILPIRRLALSVGQETPAPATYLAFPALHLEQLDQSYRRLGDSRYAYAAPRFDYEATLEVAEIGFITVYPGLWEAIGSPSTQAS
jgi:hypothetical protein